MNLLLLQFFFLPFAKEKQSNNKKTLTILFY